MNALSPLVYGLIFQKRFSASITEAGYVPRWSVLDNLKLGPLSSRWSWSSNTLATRCEVLTHWKRPLIMGKIEGKRRGTEDEHHQLNGHEFEQTLGDSEGQGRLACCSSWGHKESDMTQQWNTGSPLTAVPKLWALLHWLLYVTQPCSEDLDWALIHAKTKGGVHCFRCKCWAFRTGLEPRFYHSVFPMCPGLWSHSVWGRPQLS